ncbi:hypothetical protein EJ110_NYTH48950 [Nymphaea thermarum]|nr:hypothetical protein EJ110_NYTH48950 [Nymphaea thermarum]
MEADVPKICNAMEEGGDGVVQPATLSREASALKGPSWASIVEGDKFLDEDYMNEVEIREVDDNKVLFVPKSAHEQLKAPFRFTAIATLLGGRSSNRVRIWVRLPDLPPELWRNGIFHRLARMMGATFVEADAFTKEVASLGFARVLLEVPLGFQPVNKVRVSFEEGVALVQIIEYESKVRYCRKCGATTHFTFACDDLKQSPSTYTADVEDGKAWMAVKSPKRRSFSLNKTTGPTNQANRFSALHSVPEGEEGVNAKEGGTSAAPIPESARRKSMQADEACSEVVGHDRVSSKEVIHALTKGAPSASILQGQQSADSMVIDETHDLPVDALVSHRKASMEKKHQLKSKSTSSFKKRHTSHTQSEKLLADLYASCFDASLVRPQTIDHSSFGAAEARACPASEDLGDNEMRWWGAMRFLAWNARGLAGATAQHDLQLMFQLAHSDIAVLIDTKLNETALTKLSLKFSRYHSVSNIHLNGQWAQIWLLWEADKMQVQTSKVQAHWISIEVKHLSSGRIFSVLGVYLNPDFRIRRFQYDELNAELSSLYCWSHHVAGCPMVRLVSKLHLVRDKLREWSKQGPNDLVRIIERLRVQVGVAQNHLDRVDLSASSREIKLRLTLLKLVKMDEERLTQKARVRWMKEGDSNSKFFHAMAKGRQRRNHICTIMDGQRVLSDMDEIFASCTTYFKELLTDNARSSTLPSNVCTGLTVTDEENELLVSPIRDEKIQWAVLRAKKDSAVGPDDFNSHFYQSHWSIIRPDVSLAVKEFFRSGRMVEGGVGLQRMVDINGANFCFLEIKAITQDSLWAELVRAKYLTKKSLWRYKISGSESSLWKRVIKCWQLIESQVHWRVNNGSSVKFWRDRWSCVIISNMISPTSWPLIQDTINCTIKELFADQQTYVHMFLDSMSIPMHLPRLEDSRQDILEWGWTVVPGRCLDTISGTCCEIVVPLSLGGMPFGMLEPLPVLRGRPTWRLKVDFKLMLELRSMDSTLPPDVIFAKVLKKISIMSSSIAKKLEAFGS